MSLMSSESKIEEYQLHRGLDWLPREEGECCKKSFVHCRVKITVESLIKVVPNFPFLWQVTENVIARQIWHESNSFNLV